MNTLNKKRGENYSTQLKQYKNTENIKELAADLTEETIALAKENNHLKELLKIANWKVAEANSCIDSCMKMLEMESRFTVKYKKLAEERDAYVTVAARRCFVFGVSIGITSIAIIITGIIVRGGV